MKVVGVLVMVIFCSLWVTSDALATDTPWTGQSPSKFQDTPTTYGESIPCPTYYRDITIVGESAKKRVCWFEGAEVEIGRFTNASGKSALAIRNPHSSDAHLLEGACEGQTRCIYVASQDMLITNMPIAAQQLGVEVFRHVSTRVKTVFDPSTLSIRYIFDASNPDYLFRDSKGVVLSARSFAASRNGEWIAIEIKDHGTAVVRMADFLSRRIIPTGPEYGVGLDPTVEMAITNDGKSVAIGGSNASFLIVDITDGCGEVINRDTLSRYPPESQRCPTTQAGIPQLAPSFYTVFRPHFDDTGNQLNIIFAPKNTPARAITLRAGGFNVETTPYIALGDSFSSGEGETNETFYVSGTNHFPDTCHVSTRSYPFLLEIPGAKSVACAGAKVVDITGEQGYEGQGRRLGAPGLNLSAADVVIVRHLALDSFQPGRVAQEQFVDRYRPAIITVGIGGNDAGLMTKLRECVAPGTCAWARPSNRAQVAEEIGSLFEVLVHLYTNLNATSPSSRLFAINYPRIIDPQGLCHPLTSLLLDQEERTFMEESIRYLNDVIKAAAKRAGVGFLDIEDAYEGRRICSGSQVVAMNELRGGDDIAVLSSLPLLRIVGSETFHPTPFGHQLSANVIIQKYGDLRQYAYCSNGKLICPLTSITMPVASSYWVSDPPPGRSQRQVDFLGAPPDNFTYRVSLPRHSFRPDSFVNVVLSSFEDVVAVLRTDQQGGVDGPLHLPDGVRPAFYTLHLLGQSYDGKLVDFYQGLAVGSVRDSPTSQDEEPSVIDKPPPPKNEEVTLSKNKTVYHRTAVPILATASRNNKVLGAIAPIEVPHTTNSSSNKGDEDYDGFVLGWIFFCLLMSIGIMTLCLVSEKS